MTTTKTLLLANLKAKKALADYYSEYFRVHFRDSGKIAFNREVDIFLDKQVQLDTEIDIIEHELTKQ